MPKKILLFILLSSIGAVAQLQRYDNFAATTTSTGGVSNISVVANATITVFNYPGVGLSCSGGGCTAATTYTSKAGTTSCGNAVPLTRPTANACIGTSDSQGNFGFWAPTGAYQYCVAAASFTTQCYNIVLSPSLDAANVQYASQFTGADACAKITAAHAALATTGGVIDASGFIGSQTCAAGLTLGTTSGPIVLKLQSSFLTIPSNPCVSVVAGTTVRILGMGSSPSGGNATINCTNSTAGAAAVQWLGSRGSMEGVLFLTPSTMQGLLLDANAGGQNIKFNTFKDNSFISASGNTNDCVHFNALDSTHLVSFNTVFNIECTDFQQAYDLTMQSGGSFGPTDNSFFGGQGRRTTAAAGTAIAIGQATQNNWFFGGNFSFFTTGISIAAFSTTNQNNFYGTILESLGTTPCSVGASAADNHFYGVNCGSGGANSTDSGNSTQFDNVQLSGLTVSKQGRPWLASTFAETTAPATGAGLDACYGDSTAHAIKCSYNTASFFNQTQTIGTGNVTTAGTAINTLTCQAQTGITVTGAATTDNVVANIGAALPATWQTGIVLSAHVTATNTVTVYLCNPTATATITPAATQVNVRVTR